MRPIISIIVPVFNAEKYLHRTISSILAQTFVDFELVIINDGSTDRSMAICEAYAQADNRIKLFDYPNGGPAKARNRGINNASGDYLYFVDSDDEIEPKALQTLYNAVAKHNADIVMCGYRIITSSGVKYDYSPKVPVNIVFCADQVNKYLFGAYLDSSLCPGIASLCTKLIRREWLYEKKIRIPENRVRAEDWLFNLKCLTHNPKYVVISDVLYNYHQNEGSLMHTIRHGEWEQHFESMKILRKIDTERNLGGKKRIDQMCCLGAIEYLFKMNVPGLRYQQKQIVANKDFKCALKNVNIWQLPKTYALIATLLRFGLTNMSLRLIGILSRNNN